LNVILHIYPEGKNHVYNEWGAHCQESGINEKDANTGRGYAKFISYSGTYTERLPFHKVFYPVHTPNLSNSGWKNKEKTAGKAIPCTALNISGTLKVQEVFR